MTELRLRVEDAFKGRSTRTLFNRSTTIENEDENDVAGERANALGNSREPPAKWLFGRFASNC